MSRGYDTLESGSSHGTTTHRELCQAALVPLQSWLLVYPTLILKLVLTALLFAFAPLSLIAFVQAVISIVFLYLVVYRRIVMEGVVNFIDLIRIHKAEEHSPLEESVPIQSLHPQYFYILQQSCFKVTGETILFFYFSILEQFLLTSSSSYLNTVAASIPFIILLLGSVILKPLLPLNAIRYVCVLVSLHTSSNYLCSLSIFYLTLVVEYALAAFLGLTGKISMTKEQWISTLSLLAVLSLVPANFAFYLTDSNLKPLTADPVYCMCTMGVMDNSPDLPVRRLPAFIFFSTMITVKFLMVLWYSSKTSVTRTLTRVSNLLTPSPTSSPNAVNWTGGSMLRTGYSNIMGVIPDQVEWDDGGWKLRKVEGYWSVAGVGEVYWNAVRDDY